MTEAASQQLTLSLGGSRGPTFEDYVSGPNEAVLAAVQEVSARYSPVWPLLWGPAGCGKSHLLLSAVESAVRQGRRAVYLAVDRMLPLGVDALDIADGSELVCIDDLDHLFGSREWEEALFHAFNRWRREGCGVLMSASAAPAGFEISLADLRSRLNWGSTHALFPLDDESRRELLKRRGQRHGVDIGEEVLNYLMSRSRRAVGQLIDCVDQLAEQSFANKRKITVPLARTVLDAQGKVQENRPSGRVDQGE